MSKPEYSGNYIGRFAPSPTGPLHFGSLVCALASFLDARFHAGRWLVRIEDIDPPREVSGATTTILQQLSDHGLEWDGELLYQSTRTESYRKAITELQSAGAAYYCDCPRQRISSLGGIYDGHCRNRQLGDNNAAIRLQLPPDSTASFDDLVQGNFSQNLSAEVGDFVIRRRDGLFSYQLAVTVDDQFQGITHIIRGADLIGSTPRQIHLQQRLGFFTGSHSPIIYGHLPVAINGDGQKLSKQSYAAALIAGEESLNLWHALQWLGQPPPVELKNSPVAEILHWAIDNWKLDSVAKQISVPAPDHY